MNNAPTFYLIQLFDGTSNKYLQPNSKFELSVYTAREFSTHKSAQVYLNHIKTSLQAPNEASIIEA
jgi:hypothetical protein